MFWELSTQHEMQAERDMWGCEPSTLFIAVTPRGATWCGVRGRPRRPYRRTGDTIRTYKEVLNLEMPVNIFDC